MTADQPSTTRRRFVQAVGGAAATVAATGATATTAGATTQGGGGTLTYARGNDSGSLDPQNTTSGEDAKVTNQVYDTLINFEPGGTSLVEGLATEWNLEGNTATLTLREGVTFHDGQEFSAGDVVATWRRFTDPDYEFFPGTEYVSGYGSFTLGDWVADMTAEGETDLSIELTQQYAPFLRNLAMFAVSILSEAAIQELGTDLSTNPVGTGAFVFEEWDTTNQRIRLSRNDDYWGQVPSVDEVVFTAIGSNTSRAQTLASGEADVIDGLDPQSIEIVRNSGNAEIVEVDGLNVGYMAMNMARFEPFRDLRVRQAISYAINTQAIVETIFQGIAVQASQPLPPGMLGYNEELDPYPHDPEQAQSLLEEAGYGDGFGFELATFRNPRPYNPSPLQAAEVVRSNLAEVGVEVEVEQMPFNPFLDYTASGQHDACFLGWISDNADPDNTLFSLLHPQLPEDQLPPAEQDWVDAWDDPEYNALDRAAWANRDFMSAVEEGQQTLDPDARADLYREANAIAHDQAPWVFLDHAKEFRGLSNRVEGFQIAPIRGPFLNLVSLSG